MKQKLLILFDTVNENGRVYTYEQTTTKEEIFVLLSCPTDVYSIDQMFAKATLEKNERGVYVKRFKYLSDGKGNPSENAKKAKKLIEDGARLVPTGNGKIVKKDGINYINDYKLLGAFLTMDPADYKLPEGVDPKKLNLTEEDETEIKQLNQFINNDTDVIDNKGDIIYEKNIDECGRCNGTQLIILKAPLDYMPDPELPCPQCTAKEGDICNSYGLIDGEWKRVEIIIKSNNIYFTNNTNKVPKVYKDTFIKLLNSMIKLIKNE